jgi:hypothetical protein
MPKTTKKSAKPVAVKRTVDPQRSAMIRRVWIHSCCAILFLGLLGAAFYSSKKYVAQNLAFPSQPARVVLKNRPAWMSDLLAEQITRMAKPIGAHSAFDQQMLVDIDRILRASPWIRDVKQVRREYANQPGDTIEIDCDYRAPVALVKWKDYFWLVDGEGVKLPAQFTASQLDQVVRGADHKINIRVIEGVQQPPVESGKKWPGDDLQSGLDLVKLLYGQPYTEEIVTVDVANFAGRVDLKEAQLTLGTIHDTSIRWGRPMNDSRDFFLEVPTQRKLDRLKCAVAQYGRVDAGQPWIDIRFDKTTYSSMAQVPAN